jgi:acyl-[acyl carrier protein]--UDP-N-acetylglucosamine O-acyltransferase
MGCKVLIGSNNYVGAYNLIGSPGEFATVCPVEAMLDFEQWAKANPTKVSGVKIGSYNVFRDRVSVDAGTELNTVISDRCYLHSLSQVNHDCQLSEGVVFVSRSNLCGNLQFR